MSHKLFRYGLLSTLTLAALFVFSGLVSSVSAATCTTDGTGDFSADATWGVTGGCGATPVAGDNIVIANTHTVTLTADPGFAVGAITVQGTGVINLDTFPLSGTALTVSDSGSTVTSNTGLLTISGVTNISNANATVTSTSGNMSLGSVTNAGLFGSNDGGITITGNLTNTGTVNAPPAGNLTVTGNIDNTGGTFNHNGGTLILSGTTDAILTNISSVNNLQITKTSDKQVRLASGNLTVNGNFTTSGGNRFELGASNLSINGNTTIVASTAVTSTTGTLTFGNAGSDTIGNTGNVSSTSGLLWFRGALTNNASSYVSVNTGAMRFDGTLINSGGIYVNAGMATTTGTFTNNASAVFHIGSGNVTSTNTVTNDGDIFGGTGVFETQADYLGSGVFTPGASTFKLSGTASRSLNLGDAAAFQNNVSSAGVVTMTRNLAITGTYDSSDSNTLNADTFLLTIGGAANVGSGTTVTSTTGRIEFQATATAVGNIGTLSGNLYFGNTLLTMPTAQIHIGSGHATTTNAVANQGAFYVEAGHVTSTDNITNASGSTFNGGTGTLNLVGSALLNDPLVASMSVGSMTLRVTGAGDQGFPGATYGGIVIDKSSGTVTVSGDTIVGDGGFTTLATGGSNAVEFNGNNLTVTGNTSIGASTVVTSTASFIFGNDAASDTFTNSGTVSSTVGLLRFLSAVTNNASSNLSTNTGAMTFTGTVSNGGNIYVNAGSASTTAAASPFTNVSGGLLHVNTGGYVTTTGAFYNNGSATFNATAGTVSFQGNFNNAGTFNPSTNVYFSGSGSATSSGAGFTNLFVDKSGGTTLTFASAPTVSGTFITSGSHTTELNALDLVVSGASTIGTGTAVSSTSGALTFAGVTNAGTVTSTNGTITATTFANTGSLGNNVGDVVISNNLTNAGTINAPVAAAALGFRLSGDFDNTGGTFNHNGGTLTLAGTGGATVTSLATVYNLTISKTTGASVGVAGSDLAVANNLAMSGSNNLNMTNRALTVTGTTNLAAATNAVTSTSGVLTFASVINAGVVTSTSGSINATDFTNSSGAFLGSNSGDILFSGNLTNAGTVTIPAAASIGLRVAGNFDNSGGTLNSGGATLVLSGASGATMTSVPSLYNLTVSKTGGASIVIAGTDLSVANALTTSGAGGNFLNFTTRNLTVGGASTIGSGTAVTSTSGNLLFTSLGNSGAVSSTTGLIRVTGITTNGGSLATTAGAIRLAGTTNSGTVSFGAGMATTTAGFLNDVGGVVYLQSANVTTTANWTNSGTIYGGSGTLDFNDASFSDSATLTPETSTFVVSGSSGASMAGSSYYNLRISKGSGASVIFAASPTVQGDFTTIGDNRVNLVANNLRVLGNTSIGSTSAVTSTSGSLIFGDNAASDTFTNAGTVSSTVGLLRFLSAVTNNASSNLSTNTGAMTFTGTVSNSGNIYVNAGSASTTAASSPFTNLSGGLLHVNTGGYVTTTGAFYNNGSATFNASAGGSATFMSNFNNAGTFNPPSLTYYSGSGSATSSNAQFSSLFVDKTGGATLTFEGGNVVVDVVFMTSGSHNVELNAQNMTVAGASTIGSGTVVTSTSGTLSFAALTTVGTGAVSSTSGMIRATGATTNAGSIATTAGAIRLQDTITNSGTISFGAGVASTTAALANTGTIYIQSASVTSTGAWTNSSGGTINGGSGNLDFNSVGFTNAAGAAFTAGTGRVNFSGTGSVTVSGATYYNVTMSKAGTMTMASSTTIGNALLTVGTGTMDLATKNLTVTGDSTIGSGTTVTSTSGTLTFTGAVSNSGSIGTISGNQLYSSTLTNVGSGSVLHVGSGTATTTGALVNPGTIFGGTGTLAVSSTWSNAGTFTRGTGTVHLVGQTGQTIPSGLTFYNLAVRTTGGDAALAGYTSVSGTLTVVTSTTLAVSTYTLNAPGTYVNSGTISTGTGGQIIHANDGYAFTNGSGVTATSYGEGTAVVYLTLTDPDRNFLGATTETVAIVVTVGGDSETVTLTETGPSTGIFRNTTGLNLANSCAPEPGSGVVQVIAASGSLSSTYTDSVDSSDSTTDTVAFTATAPTCGSGGGGGGGGGGASAGSGGGGGGGSSALPTSSPLPTSFPTPAPASSPAAPAPSTPAPAPAPTPAPAPAPAPAPVSGIRFVGPPTAIVTGQSLRFSYSYRNTSRATQSVRITRELVDARGRTVRSARGTASIRPGTTYTNNVRETVLRTTPAGNYRVRVRFLDARGRVIQESSFPLTVTRPAPVRRAPARR